MHSASHPKRHPLFPTQQETAVDSTLIFSDHLPILFTCPQQGDMPEIKVISLNVMGAAITSGLHSTIWETDQGKVRYEKMVQGLKAAAERHNVDVIALQEADFSSQNQTLLENLLGDAWYIVKSECHGVITCVRKARFDIQQEKVNHREQIHTLRLADKKNQDKLVGVSNIWGIYNAFPDQKEKVLRNLLNADECVVNMVVGDTNSRIAPLDDEPKNIITGIIPSAFNESDGVSREIQQPDFPDGGFFRGQGQDIQQFTHQVLDFSTGDVVDDTRSKAEIYPSDANDAYQLRYHMVLCLDHSYQEKIIIGQQTIFQYEQTLKDWLVNDDMPDENLIVRMAANSFNEKAVAIRFSKGSPLFKQIEADLSHDSDIQFRTIVNDMTPCSCVFVPLEKVPQLEASIAYFFRLSAINTVTENVNRLKNAWGKDQDKIDVYEKLLNKLSDRTSSQTVDVIIAEWERELTAVEQQKAIRHRFSFSDELRLTRSEEMIRDIRKLPGVDAVDNKREEMIHCLVRWIAKLGTEESTKKTALENLLSSVQQLKLNAPSSEYLNIVSTWKATSNSNFVTAPAKGNGFFAKRDMYLEKFNQLERDLQALQPSENRLSNG